MRHSSQSQVYMNLYKRVQSIAQKLDLPIHSTKLHLPLAMRYRSQLDTSHLAHSSRRDITPVRSRNDRSLNLSVEATRMKPRSVSPIISKVVSQQQFHGKVESRPIRPNLGVSHAQTSKRKLHKDASESTDSLIMKYTDLLPTLELDDSMSSENTSIMGAKYCPVSTSILPPLKSKKSRNRVAAKRTAVRGERLALVS
mmetsp:Transcript_23584/g.41800  ORF Transcript_23584/g.41800 Transcript_23584/m.41800 type:complete len:198 (+) Transcript_23584:393-986(+)